MVWLHGRGDQCERFVPFFKNNILFRKFRIRCLQSPTRYVTLYGGDSTAWYDITTEERYTGNEKEAFNFDHISETFEKVDQTVKEEAELINSEKNI